MAAGIVGSVPNVVGKLKEAIVLHPGPESYVQITIASPATGGDTLSAVEGGLRDILWASAGVSDNGQYICLPVFTNLQSGSAYGGQATVVLAWFTLATMTQVAGTVNLSARTVRMTVRGTV